MANTNFDPNARFDTGPNTAGCGRVSTPVLTVPSSGSLATDGVVGGSEIRRGFYAAGSVRSNTGPNVAGAPKSINGV